MKILLSILTTITIFSNNIKWQGNYKQALEEAKQENKGLMVLLVKNSCNECRDVVAKVFTNKVYVRELNKKFVAVIINFDSMVSYPIEMYWSREFPTLFFVDSKKETFIVKPIYKDITPKLIENFLDKYQ